MKQTIKRIYFNLGGTQDWKLKKYLYNIPHGYFVKKHLQKQQKKVGVELLTSFFDACAANNVNCWLEFGTLLGAYREKSFIPHDFDLDCGMLAKDYTLDFENSLLTYGFKKTGAFYIEKDTGEKELSEITVEYKGFKLDIFLSYVNNGQRNVKIFVPYEFTDRNIYCNIKEYILPYDPNLVQVSINGKLYYSPGDPVINLQVYYGKSFMIPDPHWETASESNTLANRCMAKGLGLICPF